MRLRWLRDERGSILLFTTILAVPLMIIFGGLAMDLAYYGTVDDELQRSMDAAALAGAGNLGFDPVIPLKVRLAARDYAKSNTYRTGQITLDLNESNDLNGNIVTGIWNAGTFTKSLDGSKANAVLCQTSTTVPTSFLRLIGLNSLMAAASAIAISNPPTLPGCGTPILPIAVVPCAFYDAGTGAFNNSNGCGTGLTWISSNKICDGSPGSSQSCNSAAWASLDGTNWTQQQIKDAITNAGSANPTCNVTVGTGQNTYTDNGMVQPIFNLLRDTFISNRTPTLAGGDILRANGTIAYEAGWGGWETGVMLISTPCPPGPITGEKQILTYSKFVVTQIFDQNSGCVVTPNQDPQAAAYCGTSDPSLRAVFGYFRCDQLGQVATLDPVPRSALAQRLRLVR